LKSRPAKKTARDVSLCVLNRKKKRESDLGKKDRLLNVYSGK